MIMIILFDLRFQKNGLMKLKNINSFLQFNTEHQEATLILVKRAIYGCLKIKCSWRFSSNFVSNHVKDYLKN